MDQVQDMRKITNEYKFLDSVRSNSIRNQKYKIYKISVFKIFYKKVKREQGSIKLKLLIMNNIKLIK